MTLDEGAKPPPAVYSYVDAGDAAPSPGARWAVRVQTGADDPEPRVLAYAVSELVAKNLVLALKRSRRISLDHAREAGRWYEDEWLAEPGAGRAGRWLTVARETYADPATTAVLLAAEEIHEQVYELDRRVSPPLQAVFQGLAEAVFQWHESQELQDENEREGIRAGAVADLADPTFAANYAASVHRVIVAAEAVRAAVAADERTCRLPPGGAPAQELSSWLWTAGRSSRSWRRAGGSRGHARSCFSRRRPARGPSLRRRHLLGCAVRRASTVETRTSGRLA